VPPDELQKDPQDLSDEKELIRLAKQGDDQALDNLLRQLQDDLFRYCWRKLGNPADAEDCLQDTFLAVYKNFDRFVEGRPFRPWIYLIAKRRAIDVIRKRVRRREDTLEFSPDLAADLPLPVARMLDDERHQDMQAAIATLPDKEREVVELRLSGLPFREIAEIMDSPLGTALARMHSAVRRLREPMQAWKEGA